MKKKILLIIGTRPEFIKLFPLYKKLANNKNFITKVCFTGQHKQLISQHNSIFKIKSNFNLKIMTKNQNLFSINQKLFKNFANLFENEPFDAVCVQGDTNSAMIGALSAFYKKMKIIHVEAGLKTFDKYNPFPEEVNRDIISCIADLNLAPTINAKKNLLQKNIDKNKVFLVGNTVIDTLKFILKKNNINIQTNKQIICTMHRNENKGKNLEIFCNSIINLSKKFREWKILISSHPRPDIQKILNEKFNKKSKNIVIKKSMKYEEFIEELSKSSLVVTDSGGVQEEAAYLGKFTFILRKVTERVEILEKNLGKIIKIKESEIQNKIGKFILSNKWKRSKRSYVFGKGFASNKIMKILNTKL